MRITYNNLVRDNVPHAIDADGHTCETEVLSQANYITELLRKLVEEAKEAQEAPTRDDLLLELADLMEVIISLSTASEISFEGLEAMRLRRRERRGGFDQRLLLRYVDRVEPSAST